MHFCKAWLPFSKSAWLKSSIYICDVHSYISSIKLTDTYMKTLLYYSSTWKNVRLALRSNEEFLRFLRLRRFLRYLDPPSTPQLISVFLRFLHLRGFYRFLDPLSHSLLFNQSISSFSSFATISSISWPQHDYLSVKVLDSSLRSTFELCIRI